MNGLYYNCNLKPKLIKIFILENIIAIFHTQHFSLRYKYQAFLLHRYKN